jgi:hypothetical protein
MNTPFHTLFLAIQQQLQHEVLTLSHIAHDVGQLTEKSRPSVSWPCALIDFEEFTFTQLAENVQQATGTIVIRLGFSTCSSTAHVAPAAVKQAAMAGYDTEWQVHRALQGWHPDAHFAGALQRTSARTQRRTDGYRVREVRYRISFDDYSTRTQQSYTAAELQVVPVLQMPATS